MTQAPTTFAGRFTRWAQSRSHDVLRLAELTGAFELWLRGECVLAALRGELGRVHDVRAERERRDLVLVGNRTRFVEFKLAFNNKNLFGGYAGTGGLLKDLRGFDRIACDEKYLAVFFVFFDRRERPTLNRFFGATCAGRSLQPSGDQDLGAFSSRLALTAISDVVTRPAPVLPLLQVNGAWIGLWLHRVA